MPDVYTTIGMIGGGASFIIGTYIALTRDNDKRRFGALESKQELLIAEAKEEARVQATDAKALAERLRLDEQATIRLEGDLALVKERARSHSEEDTREFGHIRKALEKILEILDDHSDRISTHTGKLDERQRRPPSDPRYAAVPRPDSRIDR